MDDKIPDEGLQLQKENVKLKSEIIRFKEAVRDGETEIIGLKKTAKEAQAQMEKFAITLGVQNDYPTLLGEMEKLICVEDDLEIVRGQMRALKGEDEEEVGKAIAQGEKAVGKMRNEVITLSDEVKQLKSRRSVDKYRVVELAKETTKKFFQSILGGIKKFPKYIILKIKGVISLWQL